MKYLVFKKLHSCSGCTVLHPTHTCTLVHNNLFRIASVSLLMHPVNKRNLEKGKRKWMWKRCFQKQTEMQVKMKVKLEHFLCLVYIFKIIKTLCIAPEMMACVLLPLSVSLCLPSNGNYFFSQFSEKSKVSQGKTNEG